MKYFISYTRRDHTVTESFLRKIAVQIGSFGKAYIDLLDNDSDDKQKRVLEELATCDQMIVIETKEVYQSRWVQLEIQKAMQFQIPILKISFFKLESELRRIQKEVLQLTCEKQFLVP